MPLRSICANPEDIVAMAAVLEEAWAEIQARQPPAPLSVAAERERLGYIIAGLWEQEQRSDLKRQAVERYFTTAVGSSALAELTKPSDR
jgi:hypothetical protein